MAGGKATLLVTTDPTLATATHRLRQAHRPQLPHGADVHFRGPVFAVRGDDLLQPERGGLQGVLRQHLHSHRQYRGRPAVLQRYRAHLRACRVCQLQTGGGELSRAELLHHKGPHLRHRSRDRHYHQGRPPVHRVETPNCHMEDKILVDKVCTDTFEFECSPDKKLDNAGYGVKDTVCKKIPKHDCYDSPRTVQVEVCEPEYRRYCDKLTKDVPFPVERQNCHFERKKICQLVPKTKPKKAKVYSYTEDCKQVPREICDQCETKTLEPACQLEERMQCKYTPATNCTKENKKYCYKAEVTEMVRVCDKLKTSYL